MATTTDPVEAACDAICLASQLGRLDFISALLAIIGILLALAGVVAFLNFRSVARKQAKEEATKIAGEVAERVANEYLIEELPGLIASWQELARNAAGAEEANQIASVQEEGSDQ